MDPLELMTGSLRLAIAAVLAGQPHIVEVHERGFADDVVDRGRRDLVGWRRPECINRRSEAKGAENLQY